MSLRPLGDRFLLRIKTPETKTTSGLFIPETAQEKTTRGIVEAVGDDEIIKVKPGDEVIFDQYAGAKMKQDGADFVLLHFTDLLAVVRN